MNIELPSDDSEDTDDDAVFDGRINQYEAYWLYVDGVRYVGPVLDQSTATKADTDQSPLARHYEHFYEKKETYKERCRDLPGTLPKYKTQFDTPQGDVRRIPTDELNELGIELSADDDPIWLPPEYELPSVWDDDFAQMDPEDIRERFEQLRDEKAELRRERDELQETLAKVRATLTRYLDSDSTPAEEMAASDTICPGCGKAFDSVAAKNGHKGQCNQISSGATADGSATADPTTRDDLAGLAEELPELEANQSVSADRQGNDDGDLENLNHLLQGSL